MRHSVIFHTYYYTLTVFDTVSIQYQGTLTWCAMAPYMYLSREKNYQEK